MNVFVCFLKTKVSRIRVKCINTLRPRQNGRHFADDIFRYIFLNETVWIPIEISLKFVPNGPIHNIPALVRIMAWRRPGDKPLSEPMMVRLPTHICVTRPQWVKTWHGVDMCNSPAFSASFTSALDAKNDEWYWKSTRDLSRSPRYFRESQGHPYHHINVERNAILRKLT